MKNIVMASLALLMVTGIAAAEDKKPDTTKHPDTKGWVELFKQDLSNAKAPNGVWTVKDGVFTASEDQAIWTPRDYENFILDLEFKTAPGSNSGVLIYCTNTRK